MALLPIVQTMGALATLHPTKTGIDRRTSASHPGLLIAREYVGPLGLSVPDLAALVGIDATRLAAMLAGTASLDVDAAVRLGRSIGISVERLMRAQIRYDFAVARESEHLRPVPSPDVLAQRPFPDDAMHGHLACTHDSSARLAIFFVADQQTGDVADDMTSIHPVRIGDALRIYDAHGQPAWAGPILRTLDGDPLFAFVSPRIWRAWFAANARADYAKGAVAIAP